MMLRRMKICVLANVGEFLELMEPIFIIRIETRGTKDMNGKSFKLFSICNSSENK
jgi:hypothetical protein